MELAQGRAGVRAQFLGEVFADGGVAVEGLGAAAGLVQGPHQGLGEGFGERVLAEEAGQRADDCGGIAVPQFGAGPADGGVLVLAPPCLAHAGRPLAVQAGQWFAAPEVEGLAQQHRP